MCCHLNHRKQTCPALIGDQVTSSQSYSHYYRNTQQSLIPLPATQRWSSTGSRQGMSSQSHTIYHKHGREKFHKNYEVQTMLEAGIIVPSSSPWTSPLVPVHKKDGSLRLCVRLNQVTQENRYPMPRVEELLEVFASSRPST